MTAIVVATAGEEPETAAPSDPVTAAPAPGDTGLSILRVDFEELYRRHLCRHGQFGINAVHLISVLGVYFSLYSLVAVLVRLVAPQLAPVNQLAVVLGLSLPYLLVLSFNVPVQMLLATTLSIVGLAAIAVQVTGIPFWAHLLLIGFWHRVQLLSHRRYTLHRDMSAFNARYRKGLRLFTLLAVYELPILLHYLISGRSDWTR